jgi:hypothetical protein
MRETGVVACCRMCSDGILYQRIVVRVLPGCRASILIAFFSVAACIQPPLPLVLSSVNLQAKAPSCVAPIVFLCTSSPSRRHMLLAVH